MRVRLRLTIRRQPGAALGGLHLVVFTRHTGMDSHGALVLFVIDYAHFPFTSDRRISRATEFDLEQVATLFGDGLSAVVAGFGKLIECSLFFSNTDLGVVIFQLYAETAGCDLTLTPLTLLGWQGGKHLLGLGQRCFHSTALTGYLKLMLPRAGFQDWLGETICSDS